MLLGYHDFLLDSFFQVVLLLAQHVFSLPELVDGLLGRGSPLGPVLVFGLTPGRRAGARTPLEKFRDFTHFGREFLRR